jgi:hypothetical protein
LTNSAPRSLQSISLKDFSVVSRRSCIQAILLAVDQSKK